MIHKALFLLEQYFLLGLALLSFSGWGGILAARLLDDNEPVSALGYSVLRATAGLGLVTLLFFALAVAGSLTAAPVLAILVIGIALHLPRLIETFAQRKSLSDCLRIGQLGPTNSILVIIATAAFISNALVRPLTLPLGWDEVAYHLPTAQAWAKSGELLVTDWLRYPLFPFNMQLLYAGALLLASDLMAHLIHALTGFLAVALAFSLARLYMPLLFAALVPVFLVYAIREPLEAADIDLGLTLYVFAAFAALAFAYREKQERLIYLAAFFVGLALGTKYQAMFFLPSLAACLLMVERNWKVLSMAALIAIAAGCYWYVRNLLVSGDPIHPIGGPVFGFWQWNADDIQRQFGDFDGRRGLPPWYLLPSVGSLLFWRSSDAVVKGCIVACVIAVIVWSTLSGYARYLLPIYPMLAILSSYFLHRLFGFFNGYSIARTYWHRTGRTLRLAVTAIVILAIIYDWGKSTVKDIHKLVLPGTPGQMTLLRENYPGFDLLMGVDQELFGAVYQLGFEDEIYYLGTPILGDHFGRARYTDVMRLAGNARELSEHLHSLGAAYLMINRVRHPSVYDAVIADPAFMEYFEPLGASPRAVLYKLKATETSANPRVMLFAATKNRKPS